MNEKEYQYSKESLLENPQTYQFTKFEGKEFLQRYVNSRKSVKLDRVVANFGEKSRQVINRMIQKEILFGLMLTVHTIMMIGVGQSLKPQIKI